MKRILLAGLGLALLLAAAVGVWWLRSLDARVARAIEAKGSELFGTAVRVDGVDLALSEGRGTIRGLRVANPPDFPGGEAIRLEEIEIAIDARSLGEQPFRIARVRIGESVVRVVFDERGASNIERIARNASRAPADAEPEAEGGPQRIAIEELRFAGGAIHLPDPEGGDPERVDLPELAMQDVGGAGGGTGGEIGKQVARAFTRRVIAATAGHQLGRAVEKELGGAAGDVTESLLRRILD